MRRYVIAIGSLVLSALSASAQVVDSLSLKSTDGGAQQARLVVTSSTGTLHAQIRIENGMLRLSNTAEGLGDSGGDIRYDSASNEVRYFDGDAVWRTIATRTAGSLTAGGVIYASSGTNMASSSAGTSGSGVLISGGAGAPTWGNALTTTLTTGWNVTSSNAAVGSIGVRGSQTGGSGIGVYGHSTSTSSA